MHSVPSLRHANGYLPCLRGGPHRGPKTERSVFTTAFHPDWAFVFQLREGSPLSVEQLQGRIEHVTSGKASTFESAEQALEFKGRMLTETAARPQ